MTTTFVDSSGTEALLRRASQGHADAVEGLFSRHLPQLRPSIGRRLRPELRPRCDVSDVLQETHQQAIRQIDDFLQRRPMPFRLWLLKTAHQRLVDLERVHLRASKRSVGRELFLSDASSVDLARHVIGKQRSPLDEAALREQARIVRRCLSGLADADREVLLLRVFQGLQNAEIAMVLDIQPDAAKKRFARALLRLRRLLREAVQSPRAFTSCEITRIQDRTQRTTEANHSPLWATFALFARSAAGAWGSFLKRNRFRLPAPWPSKSFRSPR